MKIADITIGTRHRQDLGDIQGLAASLADVGLLHPVVVNAAGELIAGERRLAAAKLLKWPEIPATVAKNLDDIHKALIAERDENRCRKDFTPAESVAMARALEPFERKAATERMKAGRPSEKFTEGAGEVRQRIAEAVGMSHPTLVKATAVVEAATNNPEAYGDLAEEMDKTGKVAPAYQALVERAGRPGAPAVALPHKVPPHRTAEPDYADDLPPLPDGPMYRPHPSEDLCRLILKLQTALVSLMDDSTLKMLKALPRADRRRFTGRLGELTNDLGKLKTELE